MAPHYIVPKFAFIFCGCCNKLPATINKRNLLSYSFRDQLSKISFWGLKLAVGKTMVPPEAVLHVLICGHAIPSQCTLLCSSCSLLCVCVCGKFPPSFLSDLKRKNSLKGSKFWTFILFLLDITKVAENNGIFWFYLSHLWNPWR